MLALQGSGCRFEILSIGPPEPTAAPTQRHHRARKVICLQRARLRKTA